MVLASLCIRHYKKIIKGQQRLLNDPKGQYQIGQCKVDMIQKIGRTHFQMQFQQKINQRVSSLFIISPRGVVEACLTYNLRVEGSNPTGCNHFLPLNIHFLMIYAKFLSFCFLTWTFYPNHSQLPLGTKMSAKQSYMCPRGQFLRQFAPADLGEC